MLVNQLTKSEISAIFYNKFLYDIAKANRLAKKAREQAGLPDQEADRTALHALQSKLYKRISDLIAEGFVDTELDPIVTLGDTLESIDIAAKETIAQLRLENTDDELLVDALNAVLTQITSQVTSGYSKKHYGRESVSRILQIILKVAEERQESYTDTLSENAYNQVLKHTYTLDEALDLIDDALCLIGDPEEMMDAMIRKVLPQQLEQLGIPSEALELMDLDEFIEEAKKEIMPQFRAYFEQIEVVMKNDMISIYSKQS